MCIGDHLAYSIVLFFNPTYFGHISTMEARILMNFETYVNKVVLHHQPKMRVHEAKTRALAMPYKNSETSQQKSSKCIFRSFMNRHQKKLFHSLLSIRPKYFESKNNLMKRGGGDEKAPIPKRVKVLCIDVFPGCIEFPASST